MKHFLAAFCAQKKRQRRAGMPRLCSGFENAKCCFSTSDIGSPVQPGPGRERCIFCDVRSLEEQRLRLEKPTFSNVWPCLGMSILVKKRRSRCLLAFFFISTPDSGLVVKRCEDLRGCVGKNWRGLPRGGRV